MSQQPDPSSSFPWVQEDEDGVTLYVLAQPDAVENRYMGVDGRHLKVQVRAPELGSPAANRMVTDCLSDLLRVEPASVQVVGGSHTAKPFVFLNQSEDSPPPVRRLTYLNFAFAALSGSSSCRRQPQLYLKRWYPLQRTRMRYRRCRPRWRHHGRSCRDARSCARRRREDVAEQRLRRLAP